MTWDRGYALCDRCGTSAAATDKTFIHEWDWFTVYLPAAVHYCGGCKDSPERHEMFAHALQKEEVSHD